MVDGVEGEQLRKGHQLQTMGGGVGGRRVGPRRGGAEIRGPPALYVSSREESPRSPWPRRVASEVVFTLSGPQALCRGKRIPSELSQRRKWRRGEGWSMR